MIILTGPVAGRARVGVDLELAIDQVHDPVDRDAAARVDGRLLAILAQVESEISTTKAMSEGSGLRWR